EVGGRLHELAGVAENADDKWISHALLIASKVNRSGFMAAYQSGGAGDAAIAPGSGGEGISLTDRIAAGDRMKVLPFGKWTTIRRPDLPDVADREIHLTADIGLGREAHERRGVILRSEERRVGKECRSG